MVLLVYVHAFNLQPRYLQPMTLVEAPATWDNVMQYLFANGLLRFRIPILFAISGYLFARRDTWPAWSVVCVALTPVHDSRQSGRNAVW